MVEMRSFGVTMLRLRAGGAFTAVSLNGKL